MGRDNRDEREFDALDTADAYVLLDGVHVRLASCPSCRRVVCTCDDWGMEPDHLRSRRPAPPK